MTSHYFLRNRAWLLGILSLANRAGMQPISKKRLHSLIFLANCLAPIYDERGIDTRVIRHTQGPFYPDAQWDLDRLVGDGLATVENVAYVPSADHWWMQAEYRVTRRGEALYTSCSELPDIRRSYEFLVELINAFASIERGSMDAAALEDVIYRTPGQVNWAALVFDDVSENGSLQTTEAFSELVGDSFQLSAKERLNLYLGYLGRRAVSANVFRAEG
jgi:hypothetical protein